MKTKSFFSECCTNRKFPISHLTAAVGAFITEQWRQVADTDSLLPWTRMRVQWESIRHQSGSRHIRSTFLLAWWSRFKHEKLISHFHNGSLAIRDLPNVLEVGRLPKFVMITSLSRRIWLQPWISTTNIKSWKFLKIYFPARLTLQLGQV